MKFELVLHEKYIDDGYLTRNEVMDMLDMLSDERFLLIEIESIQHESVAMGFISMEFATALDFDYDNSGLKEFITNILDDMNNESTDCTYDFNGFKIWLSR